MSHFKKTMTIFIFFICIHMYALKIAQEPTPFSDKRTCIKKTCHPEFIILHFTANCSSQDSWKSFFNFLRPVSTHYIIDPDGKITQMVPESKRAWHAGHSSWHHHTDMNSVSIGIEIINPGFSTPDKEPCTTNKTLWNKNSGKHVSGSEYVWYEFTPAQIKSVIELCSDVMQRYNIPANHILGHSDIAPGRKVDPGPLFPWKTLAEHGIGIWWKTLSPIDAWTAQEVQEKLHQFGYKIKVTGKQDAQTIKVTQAFQMHFEQDNISGIANDTTMQILNNLLDQSVQDFDASPALKNS